MGKKRKKGGGPITSKASNEPDFKKAKHKLGKGKAKPSTFTNTTFSSKVLTVHTSLSEEKEDVVNYRNQTLKDALGKVKHYSPTVRREALLGLRELLQLHPSLLRDHSATVLGHTCPMLCDEDRGVRQALSLALQTTLSLVDQATLSAFVRLLMVHILAAMNHLNPAVRADTMALLGQCITRFPSLFCSPAYLQQLVSCYVGMLTNNATAVTPASSSASNPPSAPSTASSISTKLTRLDRRVTALNGLHRVLSSAVSLSRNNNNNRRPEDPDLPNPTASSSWVFSPSTRHPGVVTSGTDEVESDAGHELEWLVGGELAGAAPATTTGGGNHRENPIMDPVWLVDLCRMLFPMLVECWLECDPSDIALSQALSHRPSSLPSPSAPSASSPSPSPSRDCMEVVLSIIHTTLSHLRDITGPRGTAALLDEFSGTFRKHMFVYFPFQPVRADERAEEALATLNTKLCQVMSHFLPAPGGGGGAQRPSGEEEWVGTMVDFIADLLDSASNAKAQERGERTQKACAAVMPVMERLLEHQSLSRAARQQLVDGFASLFRKSHPRSAIKLACVQLVNDALRGYGCTNKRLPEGVIDSWVSSLPKVLWQTGASSPQTTQCILDSLATHSRSSPSPDTDSLQQALVPFFFTLGNTNTNSSSSSSKKRQKDTGPGALRGVYGPFVKLTPQLQLAAVDILYHLSSHHMSQPMLRALSACAACVPAEVATHIIETVHHRLQQSSLAAFLSFSITSVLASARPAQTADPLPSADPLYPRVDSIVSTVRDCLGVSSSCVDQATGDAAAGTLREVLTSGVIPPTVSYAVLQLTNAILPSFTSSVQQHLWPILPSVLLDYLSRVAQPTAAEDSRRAAQAVTGLLARSPPLLPTLISHLQQLIPQQQQQEGGGRAAEVLDALECLCSTPEVWGLLSADSSVSSGFSSLLDTLGHQSWPPAGDERISRLVSDTAIHVRTLIVTG